MLLTLLFSIGVSSAEYTLGNGNWGIEVEVTGWGEEPAETPAVAYTLGSGTWGIEVDVTPPPSTPVLTNVSNCTYHNPEPANNTGTYPTTVTFNITINQPEGLLFNWSIYCNGDSNSGSNLNGTYTLNLSGLSYKTWYTVNVTSDCSGNWTRGFYLFKTNTDPSENASLNMYTLDSGIWGVTVYIEYYEWVEWSDWWTMSYHPESFNNPTNLTATNYNSTGINLSWDKNINASTTVIRYSKTGFPTNITEGTEIYNGTGSSFNHSKLGVGSTYYYSAWSYNSTLGYSRNYSYAFMGTNPLQPTNMQITGETMNTISMSWTKGTNATRTVIIRNETNFAGYPHNQNNGTIVYNNTGSSFTDTGLSQNTTYYYTAISYNPSFSLFSELNATIDDTTVASADVPTNLTADVWNDTVIYLNWTKGSDYTIIRRNTGSYPTLNTGVEIYNGTGVTYTNRGLSAATHYYYRAWGWNGESPSDGYSSDDNITLPQRPQSLIGSLSGTTLTITWDKGNGATRTILRNNTASYPTLSTGTLVYNGTGEIKTVNGVDDIVYYRGWSYAFVDGVHLYSKPSTLLWGGIELNVFKESNPTIAIQNYTVFITNVQGTETYINNSANNPTRVDVSDVPNGEDISIQISKDGYHTRIKTMDLFENAFYQINFYLPPDVEGGGDAPSNPDYIPPQDDDTNESQNESYSYQYLLNVVDYHNNPIEDAKMSIKRYINTTDSFEDVSILYTDANGQIDIYLIPETIYKIQISKQYYETEYSDYIPSKSIFTHTFRMVYETTEENITETVFDGITWDLEPTQKYWSNSFTLYFNISSSDNKLEYFILNVSFYNNTLRKWVGLTNQNMSNSSGGSLNFTFPNITGKYMVRLFYKKTNFDLYEVGVSTDTGTILFWIDWGGLSENEDLQGIPDFIYFMVLTFIAMIVMAFAFRFAGLGTGYIGLGIYAFGFMLNPSVSIAGISCWAILTITAIMYTVGLYIWSRI